VLHALFIVGILVPLATMLGALFGAAWIREGERRAAPARARSRRDA
jgi:hypothetical protein